MKTNRGTKPWWTRIGRLAAIGWFGLSSQTVLAADWYVATNAVPGGEHDTWANAFTNIQDALDVATDGDTIHLAGHTFGLTNQLDWTTSGVTVRGGYEALETETAKLPGTNNPALWPTVITRASGTIRIMNIDGADNSRLDRVTITGGNANIGAGLRIHNSQNVQLTGCVISSNVMNRAGITGGFGGGIYASGSGVTLANCTVSGNRVSLDTASSSSVAGGGIWSSGALSLHDSTVANNDAICWFGNRGDGGGIWSSGTVQMKNVLLTGNLANRYGGGMCVAGGTVSLSNCTVAENLETGVQRTGGTVSLVNCIIWGHPNDLVGSSISVSFSALGNAGYDGVDGNIGADPLFEYGYYLAEDSPCRGRGSDDAGYLGLAAYTTRTDGEPYASGDETVDMGFHQMPGTVFDRTYADVYVALEGDDNNGGTLATTPFRTITRALAAARDGTRMHVATGRYERAAGETAGETFPLRLANRVGVRMIGAGAGQTVVDALGSGNRVMELLCAHRVELSGATLTGGSVAGGGGLRVERSLDVLLTDVAIVENIYHSNAGGSGGGLWAEASSMTMVECTVRSNSVTAWTASSSRAFGGGIWFRYGRLSMRNGAILDNAAINLNPGWDLGGGVHRDGNAVLDFRNVLIAGNRVGGTDYRAGGSGLYTADAYSPQGSVVLENCTVSSNTPLGGIRSDGSPLTLRNSIVWGNAAYDLTGTVTSVSYSNVGTEGYDGTDGNISADPLFIDPPSGDFGLQTRHGQYDLDGNVTYYAATSPCIDAGTNRAWMAEATDLRGTPRIRRGIPRSPGAPRVDMGAYEVRTPPAGTLILFY